jgi:hypothetical protein
MFDVTASGRIAGIGRPRRIMLALRGGRPRFVPLDFDAVRCRFRGEDLVVLGRGGELLSISPDGEKRGVVRVREGALDLAVLPGGSILVSYGRPGTGRHGVTLERFGDPPCVFRDPVLLDATCLAAESGGVWVLGTAAEEPMSRGVRLRPVPTGFVAREVVALPGPPRSAAVGPDGALYVLLEPGGSVVRVDGVAGPPVPLASPLLALARCERELLGFGAPKGLEDLTHLVPRPLRDAAPPPLPPCDEP